MKTASLEAGPHHRRGADALFCTPGMRLLASSPVRARCCTFQDCVDAMLGPGDGR